MKKLTNQTVFKCDFCSKISKSAGGMRLHELSCKNNPVNYTPCASCLKCIRTEKYYQDNKEIDEDEYCHAMNYNFGNGRYGLPGNLKKETIFTCDHDGAKMYHHKILRLGKKISDHIIASCDRMMPTECNNYVPEPESSLSNE